MVLEYQWPLEFPFFEDSEGFDARGDFEAPEPLERIEKIERPDEMDGAAEVAAAGAACERSALDETAGAAGMADPVAAAKAMGGAAGRGVETAGAGIATVATRWRSSSRTIFSKSSNRLPG
ncbi:MAG: hypothetical protein GZ088_12295 [Acidipila sp.]|nr:hypothetical protein [Acidipila sp.]